VPRRRALADASVDAVGQTGILPLLATGLLLGLSAGCHLEASLDQGHLGCADGKCPEGLVCVDAVCRDPDDPGAADAAIPGDLDDAAPGPDATPGDAPLGGVRDAAVPPAAPCNQVSLLADAFASSTRDPQWGRAYAGNGASTTQVNGRLRVVLPAGSTGSAYAGYLSSRYYDLRASRFQVAVPTMVSTASHAQVLLQLHPAASSDDSLGFEQQHGTLRFYTRHAGIESSTTLPYDPAAHLHWQLREAGGIIFFETSADGSTWSVRRSVAAPFDVSLVSAELSAGVFQSESAPGFAELDDVNGGVPAGSACKAATLADGFEGGVRDVRWARAFAATGCTAGQASGSFFATPPASTTTARSCGYESAAAFDLTGSQVVVEVGEVPAAGSAASAFLKLADDGNHHGVELAQVGGQLQCRRWLAGASTSLGQFAFDPVAQRFWRLAESGGLVRWQTSPDGGAWTTRCSADTASVDVDDVEVTLGASQAANVTGGAAPGSFRVEALGGVP
jgi:hypothetical protein